MGILIGGVSEEVEGLVTCSWIDPAGPGPTGLRLTTEDREERSAESWIHAIVLHTTRGIPGGLDQRRQKILAGVPPTAERVRSVLDGWASDHSCASAHFVIDFDGTVACVADPLTETTYHAGHRAINHHSIGIEMYQGESAELYQVQLESTVRLVDFLTRRFGIQRQFHWPYHNQALARILDGGSSVVGVYGHREASDDRGEGDPGDAIFEELRRAGYERFNFAQGEDLAVWRARQEELNLRLGVGIPTDGVPGQQTVLALREADRPHGLWVSRPGDSVGRAP